MSGPPINAPKQYLSAVILPDRTVLQTNGAGRTGLPHRGGLPVRVRRADLPSRHEHLEDAPNATVGRAYHSEALLLPDGRVATFGSNSSDQDSSSWEQRIEIYKPAYWNKPRPVISVAPQAQVPLGGSLRFSSDKPLKWVELVRPSRQPTRTIPNNVWSTCRSARTHHARGHGDRRPNKYLVPPGYYMLFGVDADNVPSVASWVLVTYNTPNGGAVALTG